MKIVQNFHTRKKNWIFFVPDVCTSIPVIILRLGVLKRCLKKKVWFSDIRHTFWGTKLWALKKCSFPLGSSIWFWKKKKFEKSQNFEMCLMNVNKIQFFSKFTLFLRFGTTYRYSEHIWNTSNFGLKIKIEKILKSCCKTACFFSTSRIDHSPNIGRHRTKTL